MDKGLAAIVFTLVLLGAGIATVPVGTGTAATSTDGPTLSRTTTLSLTPTDAGEVDVVVAYTIPDSVTEVTTRLPDRAVDVTSQSFTNIGNTTWQWQEGNGTAPTISFTLTVNETGAGETLQASGPYLFVDTGSWALVQVPSMPIRWLRTGPAINFESNVTINGQGATGGEMAYLGPYTEYTRTEHDQTFRLVVPDSSSPVETPTAIFNSLTMVSNRLRVGERDDSVFLIAAPASIDWGARGLSGGSDAWVVASEHLDDPGNAWIHEYIHTRQAFRTTFRTRWLTEATATYYAALFTLEQNRITFQTFRQHLARGGTEPVVSTILADPRTWAGGTNYVKGSLVWGAFDYRLRIASDSQVTAAAVISRMNAESDSVTGAEFLAIVEAVGGDTARDFMAYYTSEPVAPEMWSEENHATAFDSTPPLMSVELQPGGFAVTGAYRNSSTLPDTVVTGETITVTATVTNIGGTAGTFQPTLTVDGVAVASTTVDLEAGGSTTVELSHVVDEPGIVQIGIGSVSRELRVAEPATPTVTNLSVNRSQTPPGGTVGVAITLQNTADWPGGPINLTVDGNVTQTLTPTLVPGAETTLHVTITLSEIGSHDISVGNQTVSVTVQEAPTQPGFQLGTTVGVTILTLLAIGLYRRLQHP